MYKYNSKMGIGIQLQPTDVQIIELVENTGGERGKHKFGAREGGWTPPARGDSEGGEEEGTREEEEKAESPKKRGF